MTCTRGIGLAVLLAFTLVSVGAPPAFAMQQETYASSQEFDAVIEIPADSAIKYERDEATGTLFVDRFLSMPVAYPANYGSILQSRSADGDPLDVLVYTRAPILPGAHIRVRAIGILRMTDGGDVDDKIIAVPVASVDPTYEPVREIDDLPVAERRRLEMFFRTYKQLPDGGSIVEVGAFQGVDSAVIVLDDARRAYAAAR